MLSAPPVAPACGRTFTVAMVKRAIRATYARPRVSDAQRDRLDRYIRCSRNPAARKFLHGYWHRQIVVWKRRLVWNGPALASWYNDAGNTACGFHARYGFASLFLACGTRITMSGPGGTVMATMQDHGPYIAGRTFDLNPGLKAVIGCSDLCSVKWRLP